MTVKFTDEREAPYGRIIKYLTSTLETTPSIKTPRLSGVKFYVFTGVNAATSYVGGSRWTNGQAPSGTAWQRQQKRMT